MFLSGSPHYTRLSKSDYIGISLLWNSVRSIHWRASLYKLLGFVLGRVVMDFVVLHNPHLMRSWLKGILTLGIWFGRSVSRYATEKVGRWGSYAELEFWNKGDSKAIGPLLLRVVYWDLWLPMVNVYKLLHLGYVARHYNQSRWEIWCINFLFP